MALNSNFFTKIYFNLRKNPIKFKKTKMATPYYFDKKKNLAASLSNVGSRLNLAAFNKLTAQFFIYYLNKK